MDLRFTGAREASRQDVCAVLSGELPNRKGADRARIVTATAIHEGISETQRNIAATRGPGQQRS